MSEKKKQAVRRRDIHLHFCVDEEERELIRDRMERAGIRSMGAYLRKMAIDGYHVNLDLTDVRKMVALLHRCSGNVNQIAKRANETRSIYAEDLKDLRQQYDLLWDAVNEILRGLAKIA